MTAQNEKKQTAKSSKASKGKPMRLSRLVRRSLVYYWRTNLAVIAGVATAVAVLSGALLVGKSVRVSLRELLYQRIGAAEYVVSADRFFRVNLADGFVPVGAAKSRPKSCAIIYLQGVAIHEGSGMRAYNVNVYGVDERFWQFQEVPDQRAPQGRTALVGAALAQRLGLRTGDDLLLRIETQPGIPRELLYGHRENVGRTLRLTCGEILPVERLGEFALRPSQGSVYTIFVPLQRLQRDLVQPGRANAILLAPESQGNDVRTIRAALKEKFTLEDLGAKLRPLPSLKGIAVESNRILLDDSIARAAFDSAEEAGMRASGIFTYLANSIRVSGHEIPYSVITAADLWQGSLNSIRLFEGFPILHVPTDANESIWLNEWAWRDLGGSPGELVEVEYYVWQAEGRLATRTARFRLAGVVAADGDVDSSLAPDFPGITETRSMTSWDPPFPLDLSRIRPKDEEYWNRYKATPKAFITLAKGQELWQNRFGKLTAVRVAFPAGADLKTAQDRLAESVRRRLDPESSGFAVNAVKKGGLDAAQGSTDFGEYFVYFSLFLIAAAVLFSAMFFRLGIEQRVREIGTLQAAGFAMSRLRRLFFLEGAILSTGGILLGLLGAIGYGGLLVFGLRTWWVGAVGTRRLTLHLSWVELCLGAAAATVASLGMIAWTLRGMRRNSPRALLAGVLEPAPVRRRHARVLGVVAFVSLLAAALMLLGSIFRIIPDVEGFFGAGALLLVSTQCLIALYLRRDHPSPISGHGWPAFLRLGIRNAMHRPGRSLVCVALIASAAFVIVSVEAFRRDPRDLSPARSSGTGGYPLLADSALPIVYDPNSPEGREALGIPTAEVAELAQVKFVPFRVRPGDDASCLNLYAPQEPRILGASDGFLADARFSFQESLASTPEQKRNPWLLLESASQDGSVPAIADANTIQYILRLSLGRELTVRGSNGVPVRLRLVAALHDSILQGELVISEANFLRAFPDREGYRFFLLDVPFNGAESLVQPLTDRLADWGFNVELSRERLAAYRRVENTYLSTFQSLGALGLILGTAGLATVLLRNALERRRELALLRAVGYRRRILSAIIVAENMALMICGLACGAICALIAILPSLRARGGPFPAAMLGLILTSVLIVGLASSCLAVTAALRSPLLDSLKSE